MITIFSETEYQKFKQELFHSIPLELYSQFYLIYLRLKRLEICFRLRRPDSRFAPKLSIQLELIDLNMYISITKHHMWFCLLRNDFTITRAEWKYPITYENIINLKQLIDETKM